MSIYTWEMATISDYKPLEDCEGWLKCPHCNEYPRVWVFDNGNFARCRCNYKYDRGGAAATSFIEAVYKRRMAYDEYKNLLRDAWNKHVKSLPLPSGEVK